MSSAIRSGVYVGSVTHWRHAPRHHAFTYRVFMVLLDIDRIPELMRVSPFTSYNRWNWASFRSTDHFGDRSRSLRDNLQDEAVRHSTVLPDGPIFLLTHLRYLGYCFNPVSFFYCFDRGGSLQLVVAEVHNTFGGAHNYWLHPVTPSAESNIAVAPTVATAATRKTFFVSPFLPRDMDYAFELTPPTDRIVVRIRARETTAAPASHRLDATLQLSRRPWTAGEIARVLVRRPAMTLQVMGAIHWEALRLWAKGLTWRTG